MWGGGGSWLVIGREFWRPQLKVLKVQVTGMAEQLRRDIEQFGNKL